MDAPERKRNPRGQGERLREQLIDAAGELLREQGDAGRLSVRAVTARAGVSPTALYLQFANLEELLVAVLARAFEEFRRYLRDAQAPHEGDPDAQLAAMGRAYVAFALERPALYDTIFGPRVVEKPGVGRDAFEDVVRAVARCLRPGDDRDPELVAVGIWSELHGIVTLRHAMPGFPWPPLELLLRELQDRHVARL